MGPITRTRHWEPFADCLKSDAVTRIGMKFHVDPSYLDNIISLSQGNMAIREGDSNIFTAECSWKDLTEVVDTRLGKITHQFINSIETADGSPLLYAPPPDEEYELDEMGSSEPIPKQNGVAVVNGTRLEFQSSGNGPLVLMLHDLFDTNQGFRSQIDDLAETNTVIAPNLPGYGLSQQLTRKPTLEAVADLMAAFIADIGDEKATIVGQGYGGTLAWVMAYRYPELIESIVVINGPHPVDFAKKLASSLQLFRSWNFFLFQIPYLPQWILRASDGYLLKSLIRSWSLRPAATDPMARALMQNGALDNAFRYYKGALRGFHPCAASPYAGKVRPRVKVIWSEKNPHMGLSLAKDSARYTNWIRVKKVPRGGHWLSREEPETLNQNLKDMLD